MNEIDVRDSGPAVNLSELLSRVDNDRELVCELFEMFKTESPQFLQSLRTAVASGDLKATVSASHTMKGMLANLGINRAAGTAARLEKMGRNGEAGGLATVLDLLESEVGAAMPELDSYLAETKP